MISINSAKPKFAILFLLLTLAGITGHTQNAIPISSARPQPRWWFGISGAGNFNFYRGTTQMLNNDLMVPAAFHKGDGVKPYVSLLTEYRPNKVWGGMLNIAYDNRGGKFDGVMAPCNCAADLSTNISYVTIEPSLRLAPFSSAFYVFAGPTLSFNVANSFSYTQEKQTDKKGDWSNIRSTVFSGQAGAGIDIPVSSKSKATQMTLSPFVSFLTDFGHEPRKVESWSFYTIRAGIALKIGKSKKTIAPAAITETSVPAIIVEKEVAFSIRAPKNVAQDRKVKETFPIRNSVFFDQGSTEIPGRYVLLNKDQATTFKEEQLQLGQPSDLTQGRSVRQLAVYHNILNILGSRMLSNPDFSITLTGASDKNPKEGKLMAEEIKKYLVDIFGISASRINTVGRDKPVIPSEQPGSTNELALQKEGDRRVDITSTSPELLSQVGGGVSPLLKPIEITSVQKDPLDSHLIFDANGANELLKSWTVDVTDDGGFTQHYGPYMQDQASVPGTTILGNKTKGTYTIVMRGETKSGHSFEKSTSVSLVKIEDPKQEGLRYSILFDFDKSKSISSYEDFLANVVTPLIPENGTVTIHGHTDIIGEENHNRALSEERAKGAQQIIEAVLLRTGKKGVKFETTGFGEDINMSPFENNLPEERFYNRTVIIDILPAS